MRALKPKQNNMMEYIDNLSLEELEEQLAHNTDLAFDLARK